MRAQVVKENELLRVVLLWQEKTEVLEKEVWGKVESYWGIFETAKYVLRLWSLPRANPRERSSHLHLTNQQRSVFLSANVDSVSPDVRPLLSSSCPSSSPDRKSVV